MTGALSVAVLVLVTGQPADSSAPAPGSKEYWEAKARVLPVGHSNDDVTDTVDQLRGFTPHVSRRSRGSTGGQVGCGTWSGGSFELDANWKLVRDQGAPTTIDPAEKFRPPSYRVVGLEDLRQQIDPTLFEAMQIIHRSPTVGDDFDPVRLIRAVNMLQAMGEEKANKALEAYDELCRSNPCDVWNGLDTERIIWIARLLYPPKPGDSIRPPALGQPDVSPPPGKEPPLFPLLLMNDIPFCPVAGYLLDGVPEDALRYAHFCRAFGKFREKPLIPSTDPIRAAEALSHSQDVASLTGGWVSPSQVAQRMRSQALFAASNIVGDPGQWLDTKWHMICADEAWQKAIARVEASDARWEPRTMDFVASTAPSR